MNCCTAIDANGLWEEGCLAFGSDEGLVATAGRSYKSVHPVGAVCGRDPSSSLASVTRGEGSRGSGS
jgi:hypothetical protein